MSTSNRVLYTMSLVDLRFKAQAFIRRGELVCYEACNELGVRFDEARHTHRLLRAVMKRIAGTDINFHHLYAAV